MTALATQVRLDALRTAIFAAFATAARAQRSWGAGSAEHERAMGYRRGLIFAYALMTDADPDVLGDELHDEWQASL